MKKIIFTLLLTLNLLQARTTSAASMMAGALEPTQWLNQFQLLLVDSFTGNTSVQQTLSTVKQLTDPIMAGLISVAQQAATKSIIQWANGGFSGQPLIVSNPEKFITNAGLTSVKATLSHVPTNSVLGDSIFTSILNSNKQVSITTQLEQLSKSPTASIIQKKNCDDPNTLMDRAQKQAEAAGGTQDEINARYAKFYEDLNTTICSGDPNTDPAVAKKLDSLAANNPSLGGWDLWLTSANDNEYQRVTKASKIAATEKAVKSTTASNDIYQGAGAISQTECAEYVKNNAGAETSDCEISNTITQGKVVQDSISKAVTSPLDRLANLTGADGLTSLLTGFITSALQKGLNSAFSSGSSGARNTASTTWSTQAVTQDLAGKDDEKASMVAPILKMLKNAMATFTELDDLDTQFLNDMVSYEAKIAGGRSCYNTLTTDFPELANDGRVVAAYAFYTERQGRVDAIKKTITPEKAKIVDASAYIDGIKIKIANSNSTQEISNLYTAYSAKVDQAEYPTITELAKRKGEYQQSAAQVKADTREQSPNEGEMTTNIKQCASIRQEKTQGTP